MIDKNHALSVKRQAELVGISRGTVYYAPRPVSDTELLLMRHLDELHLAYPFMGARMLRDQLNRQGFKVGRKHVVYPYLLRNLTIDRANQVWALDTTYIPMMRRFVYLTAVID